MYKTTAVRFAAEYNGITNDQCIEKCPHGITGASLVGRGGSHIKSLLSFHLSESDMWYSQL